jgi:hypothetical protein
MTKSMTTDSVRGDFSAAAGRDENFQAPAESVSKFKPVTTHQMAANDLQQVRNGTPKQFDAPSDRGPSIGSAAGMTPTKL